MLVLTACAVPQVASAQTSSTTLPLPTQANVWLNAGAGVTTSGSSVTTWADQSGNTGRNATQGTSTAQPTLVTSSTNFAGQAALQFDGGDFLGGTWRASSSSQVTQFAVYKLTSTGSTATQVPVMTGTQVTNQGFGVGWNSSGIFNAFLWGGASRSISGFSSATQIQAGAISSSTSTLWLNGQTATGAGGSPNVDTGYTVGKANGATNLFLGNGSQVAEVVIFDTVLSAADVTTMGNYLAAKYGVATTTSRLWSGGSSDVAAASNWGGTLTSGDQLVFTGATETSPTLATNLSVAGVAFTGLGTSGTFTVGGSGTLTLGANGVANWTTGTQSISAPLALSQTAAWNIVGGVSIGGQMSGAGGLTKSGTGTLTLSGSNNYTGATSITSGTLQIGDGGTSGLIADASTVSVSTGATLAFNRSDALTYGGTVSGAGGLRKLGSGTVTLTANNTYTGTTTISAGALQLGNVNALANSTLDLATGDTGAIAFTVAGTNTYTLGGLQGSRSLANGGNTLTVGGNGGSTTYSGVYSGTGGLTKTGTGTLTLSNGGNSFTGPTVVNQGTLVAGAASTSTGRGDITINQGATLRLNGDNRINDASSMTISGGTFAMQGFADYIGNLTLGGGAVVSGDGSSLITNGTANSKIATSGTGLAGTISSRLALASAFGNVTGNRTQEFAIGADAMLLITGTIIDTQPGSGARVGSILKTGSGTLTLTAANTYTGSTSITTGTLQIGNGGTTGSILNTSGVSVSAGAVLAFNRTDNYGGSIASVISGSGAVRVESGFLDLLGVNTYTGATDVLAGGTLAVNGSLANTNLTVASGATLMGSGTIQGLATIAGMHRPGNSPGVETFTNLTYTSGAGVQWELWNNTASNSPLAFDQIVVNGDLMFAGATTLDLVFTGSAGPSNFSTVAWSNSFWDSNQEWLLYDVTGALTSANNLALTVTNWQDSTGAFFGTARPDASFKVEQRGSDVYVVYAAVPEPGSLSLAGIGLLAAGWITSRRRRAAWAPR